METVLSTCPICHSTQQYGGELVGRYTFCRNCRARFYVEVPTLDAPPGRPALAGARTVNDAAPSTTLDDLLMDTQQGSRHIIESIRRQEASLRMTRWLVVAAFVVGAANLAAIVVLLLRK